MYTVIDSVALPNFRSGNGFFANIAANAKQFKKNKLVSDTDWYDHQFWTLPNYAQEFMYGDLHPDFADVKKKS